VTDPDLKQMWWLLLLLGVGTALIGLALIVWPGRTALVVLTLIGIYMLVVGVVRFIAALFVSAVEHRWLQAFLGILGIVLGLVVIRQSEGALALIVLLTGLFWVIAGLVDLFRGVTDRKLPDRGLRIGLGVASVVVGGLLLLWPAATFTVLAIIVGVQLIIVGVLESVASFQFKSA